MWWTGPKTPSGITEDQSHAVHRAVPPISDKVSTKNGKNLYRLILNSSFLFTNL